MIRHFLRIGSMFLTFKNSPKHKYPSQTHIETHIMAYESIKTRMNANEPIKTQGNTTKTTRTAN